MGEYSKYKSQAPPLLAADEGEMETPLGWGGWAQRNGTRRAQTPRVRQQRRAAGIAGTPRRHLITTSVGRGRPKSSSPPEQGEKVNRLVYTAEHTASPSKAASVRQPCPLPPKSGFC